MKFFSSTQISWSEPWFFLIRIREASGWRWRILLALGVAVLMFLAIYFLGQPNRGFLSTVGVSLLVGLVVIAMLDFNHLQRDVTIKDDCIIIGSTLGRGWFVTYKFSEISGVQLLRPADWNKPFGGMVIHSPKDNYLVAVPNKVSLDIVANILNRLGVAVSLSGWEPSQTDTRIGVRDQLELNPQAVHGEISVEPIGSQECALLAPSHLAVQLVIALGPLLLALIAGIAAAVILFRHWGEMSIVNRSLHIGVPLVAFIGAFVYLIMVGQFLAAAYGISVARGRLLNRSKALFRGTESDLVCVEIFDRQNWTSMVAKSADYGFLRIETAPQQIRFEGNKFRWVLPFSAIKVCRIEESIVGSEGNTNPEKRYFVVLAANQQGENWEAGMVYTRTEMGNDNAESRHNRAQLLFTQLAAALAP